MKENTILKVSGLSVSYGEEEVIKNMDLEVERGEFVAIIGPNGAGKTTFMRAVAGMLDYSGKIIWNGEPSISYLPERLSLAKFREYPLTVAEFFKMHRMYETSPFRSSKSHYEVLESVGLEDVDFILKKNPGELSSGQFQRMLVAWAMLGDPDVLLFDEPTTGIDIGGEETIHSLIYKLWKERDLTVFVITHELNVVYAYAANVLCMRRKEHFYGPPDEVLTPERLREIYGTEIKFHVH